MSSLQADVPQSDSVDSVQRVSLRRLAGISFGIGTQVVFAFTAVDLFSFLKYGAVPSPGSWFLVDALLALQFAIPHSLLLHPAVRKRLRPWISPEFYGAFFCVGTSISLLLVFAFWRGTNSAVWELQGTAAHCMVGAYFCSWAALLYSVSLTGLGFQTGWTQWLCWYRGEKLARREFTPRGLYRFLRHPVYLSSGMTSRRSSS